MITKINDYYDMNLSDIEKQVLPLHILIILPRLIEKWYKEALE